MHRGTQMIANYYGKENQTVKAMEELAELIQALAKGDIERIKEEFADVQVMLEQIKYLYGLSELDISRVMFRKIVRQMERIEAEEKRYEEEEKNRVPEMGKHNAKACE
ncbi:MAG: hypothetical protein ACI4LK_02410 [Lentihominibacter sp.]